jgi:transposase
LRVFLQERFSPTRATTPTPSLSRQRIKAWRRSFPTDPKRNRKIQREYDEELYKLRHLVENAFLHLKRWRGIETRYAKNAASFLAAIHIRCITLWAAIS